MQSPAPAAVRQAGTPAAQAVEHDPRRMGRSRPGCAGRDRKPDTEPSCPQAYQGRNTFCRIGCTEVCDSWLNCQCTPERCDSANPCWWVDFERSRTVPEECLLLDDTPLAAWDLTRCTREWRRIHEDPIDEMMERENGARPKNAAPGRDDRLMEAEWRSRRRSVNLH